MLSYQQERDTISRTMAVMETRASRHDPAVRTFVIGPQGIALDEPPSATKDAHQGDSGLTSVPPISKSRHQPDRAALAGRIWWLCKGFACW
jgi:hypothetical protein